ncbi:MAG TPA: 50S ribosomal protein L10, partial [Thermoplasmata archaeon]|nr:50S ribosomal protein L10 [Thermoplasmata archaeon]
LALALEIAYASPATIPALLGRAHRRALTLAADAGYLTPETLPIVLARAAREAAALHEITGT